MSRANVTAFQFRRSNSEWNCRRLEISQNRLSIPKVQFRDIVRVPAGMTVPAFNSEGPIQRKCQFVRRMAEITFNSEGPIQSVGFRTFRQAVFVFQFRRSNSELQKLGGVSSDELLSIPKVQFRGSRGLVVWFFLTPFNSEGPIQRRWRG